MTAPPALVEAFLARIGRVLDAARALPWRDLVLYYQSKNAEPFTVATALEKVERKAPAMAAELAAELYRLAVALVDPDVLDRVLDIRRAELVSKWPFPRYGVAYGGVAYGGVVDAAWYAIEALADACSPRDECGGTDAPAGFYDPWPAGAPPVDVARWAHAGLNRAEPDAFGFNRPSSDPIGAGDFLAGVPPDPEGMSPQTWALGGRRYPGRGLALLYLAERAELPRVRATVAARLAFASVRDIAGVRDPGPLHFAALEAVLGEAGAGDLATAALADGATRAGFAAELVSEARRVAEVVFTGDAPEGETEARALAGEVAERFAAVLDGCDPKAGAAVRGKAAERAVRVGSGPLPGTLWILWIDPDAAPEAAPRWLDMLARALWVGPKGWRAALAKPPKLPGFTVRTGRALVDILSPAAVVHRGPVATEIVSLAGRLAGQIEHGDVRRMMPPTINAEDVRRMTSEIVKARAATAAVYALVQAVYTVTDLENQGDTSLRASWESWPEWVAAVSSTFGVDPTDELAGALKRAAWFGNAVQVPLFDGRIQRGLWTLTAPDPFKRGAPRAGDSRVVTFGYAPIFSHKWASQENPDDRGRGVRLVIIPRTFPIGVADRTVRAPMMLFTLDVLAEAAMCPNPHLGMVLSEQRRAELARGVGLPDAYAPRQLSAMVEAGILEGVGPDRYRLGSKDARTKASPRRSRRAKNPGST